MDIGTDFRIVGTIMRDLGGFEGGKPMTVELPATDSVVDMSEFGLGHVRVQQAGVPLTITKLPD